MNRHLYTACLGVALLTFPACSGKSKSSTTRPVASVTSSKERIAIPAHVALDKTYTALISYDYAASRKPLSTIEQEVRSAKPDQYAAIEAKLLTAFNDAKATPAARQFILRTLARVGSAASVSSIAPYLTNDQLSHMARYALQPIAHESAAAALREALPESSGKIRIGLISSLGDRRDTAAIPLLTPLTQDLHSATAAAAINALGDIGTTGAARAISSSLPKIAAPLHPAARQALITTARHLARDGNADAAAAVYRSLTSAPEAEIRAAAVEGLITTQPLAEATELITKTMSSEDALPREAALAAVSSGKPELRRAMAERLPKLTTDQQIALLPVVTARDVDISALLNMAIAARSTDPRLRLLAIESSLTQGPRIELRPLINFAASGTDDEKRAAREVLRRIDYPGATDKLIALARSEQGAARTAATRALVDRGTENVMPVLIELISGGDDAAREAAQGLANIGTPAQLPKLIEVISSAKTDEQRQAAAGAISSIAAKTPDKQAAAAVILPALANAPDATQRKLLMPTLSRLGTPEALAAANQRIAEEKDPALQSDAVRELAGWPTVAAAPALFELAKSSQNPTHRVLALQGFIRLARESKTFPAAARVAMLRDALAVATRPDEKRQALSALAEVPSAQSLELLQSQLKDKEIGAEAALAAIKLARQLGGVYNTRAVAALKQIQSAAPSGEIEKQAADALAAVAMMTETDGYILAFLVSGPYTQGNRSGNQLFDTPFPPEKDNGKDANWQPALASADNSNDRVIHLDRILGQRSNRVAYLKTTLTSDQPRKAILELGSDDGVKVFLNNQQVHANNVSRGLREAEDKVALNLKQGRNILVIKVTQNAQQWAAVARLRSESGGKLDGVTASAE